MTASRVFHRVSGTTGVALLVHICVEAGGKEIIYIYMRAAKKRKSKHP